ncbi:cytochrome P450, partial [Lasiosphaeria miniovina]
TRLHRRYQRLKHIKGPLLAAFTDLWRARIQFFGPIQPMLLGLHSKYGPVVRVGPNTVSFSDPADMSIVFSARSGFAKVRLPFHRLADSYGGLRAFVGGKSVGSILDMGDDENRAVRRAMGNTFVTKNLLCYEDDVDATLATLLQTLRRRAAAGTPFDLFQLLQLFQLDFLLRMAFSEDPGHLRHERDVIGIAKVTHRRVAHWYAWQPVPALERFVFQNRLWSERLLALLSLLGRTPSLTRWHTEGAARVAARQQQHQQKQKQEKQQLDEEEDPSHRPDLLARFFAASAAHPSAIRPASLTGLVNSTISAGADTTTSTLAIIIYCLAQAPAALAQLRAELAAAGLTFPAGYAAVDATALPYLDAVIKEAMRLFPNFAMLFERVVPDDHGHPADHEGACPACCRLANGKVAVPPGTVVGCAPLVVHRDEAVFGEHADAFRPERWLPKPGEPADAARDRIVVMERTTMAWGLGSRTCLGRHVAEMEMKKVVPNLVSVFDFELCNPKAELKFEMGVLDGELSPIMVT